MDNNQIYKMQLISKEQQLREMEAQLIALQYEYHQILNSEFWKGTQWMRSAVNFLRGTKTKNEQKNADSAIRIETGRDLRRVSVEQFVDRVKDYDVVSFDIFDTLVLRNCKNPTDVFDFVSLKIGVESFTALRVQAEEYARKNAEKGEEISLDDIYNVLSQWIQIDKESVMRAEIEAEIGLCTPNPYIRQVYDTLKALDKRIIIVSDMYLPAGVIEEILKKCGYNGYEKLYVSNEYLCSKATGSLYEYINSHIDTESIIHIGDNYTSDILNSEKSGWKSFYYPSCKSIATYGISACESPVGSIYSGLVINKLFSGAGSYSKSYMHGYAYGGIITAGYCRWLNQFASAKKADKILFLARDAEIFEAVYGKYLNEIPYKYMVVSRFSMWQIVFDIHTEEYIRFFFRTKATMGQTKIGDALKETDIEFLVERLAEHNLDKEEYLTESNYKAVRKFIYHYRNEISESFLPMRKAAEKYFNYCIGDAKRIVVSDLGWSGQILLHMRHFIKQVMKRDDVEVIGAFMATSIRKDVNHYVNSGVLSSYLYSYGQNRDMYMPIDNFAGNTAVMCLEAMFSSASPTLMEYRLNENDDFEFLYGAETTNEKSLNDMHRGILDFISDWYRQMKALDIQLSISAADAFVPYENIAMDWTYLVQVFGDFIEYTDSIPRLGKSRMSSTLAEIMHQRFLL